MSGYNILGELSVCILSVILLFNVMGASSLKGRSHKLFVANCFLLFFSTATNMVSVYCIEHFDQLNLNLCTAVTTTYFALLMISPFMLSLYGYSFLSQRKQHVKLAMAYLLTPIAFSYVVLILNWNKGLIFRYDAVQGYIRGPFKNITYVITAVYAIFLLYNVYQNRHMLSNRLIEVFALYPVVSVAISMIQLTHPAWLMAGTAAIATILLLYITVQADITDYDLTTGLPTERHLQKIFYKNYSVRDYEMCTVYIENHMWLRENFDQIKINNLFMALTKVFSAIFGHHVYLLENNRFVILSSHLGEIAEILPGICEKYSTYKTDDGQTINVEFKSVMLTVPQDAQTFTQAILISNRLFQEGVRANTQDIVVCDANHTNKMKRENQIYEILQRELTLESKDYQVYYQPIYDVKEGKFKYCECLSRLYDKELGNISPAEFVPIAENKGLIEKMGTVAFEKICKFMSENSKIPAVTVNFSVYQMMNPAVVDNVMEIMHKYNLDPNRIIIEVTESIIVDNFEVIKDRMTKFSKEGLVFYLDDFGTGYSNFANVVNLPFKTIKFDRSSMLMMEESNKVKHFFTNLIHFFQSQGLNIVVEGVETDGQDAMVKESQANYIQGFRYSKPLPQDEVLKLF